MPIESVFQCPVSLTNCNVDLGARPTGDLVHNTSYALCWRAVRPETRSDPEWAQYPPNGLGQMVGVGEYHKWLYIGVSWSGFVVWLPWDSSSWPLGFWGSHCCAVLVPQQYSNLFSPMKQCVYHCIIWKMKL